GTSAGSMSARMALAYAACVAERFQTSLQTGLAGIELPGGLEIDSLAVREGLDVEMLAGIGRDTIERGGANTDWIADEAVALTRESVRMFARAEVAPIAGRIHEKDELVPEELIAKMAQLGFFSASVPEEYGGSGLGYRTMVVTTEE